MERKPPSLFGRALAALALAVGFHVLAFGIAAALLALPWLEYRTLERVHFKLALGSVVGAGVILYAVVPRRDRFIAPGILLERIEQPALFAALEEVAHATRQRMPDAVYLCSDVNAFVGERGGWLGIGRRRILGIGLPLLRVFDVDELRAVLAHEFGHFHGGDTRLAGWIWNTRAAIGRTITTLEEKQSVLSAPFRWYGSLFLRVTQAISREQEFAADRLAAQLTGAAPLASGLARLPAASRMWPAYFDDEYAPVLRGGRRAPLAAGFASFLRAKEMAPIAARWNAQALADERVDPFDTHPPLGQRTAAVADLPARAANPDRRPALALLAAVGELERRLVDTLVSAKLRATLRPIEWRDVGEEVQLPAWRERRREWSEPLRQPLAGATLGALPAMVARAAEFGAACSEGESTAAEQAAAGRFVLSVVAAVALHEAGFDAESLPGEAVALERRGHRFEPQRDVAQLGDGKLAAADWEARCRAAGVAELPLDGDAPARS